MEIIFDRNIPGYTHIVLWKLEYNISILEEKYSFSNAERESYNAIRNQKRRIQWLNIRLMLEKMIGERKEIIYNNNGKPFLKDFSRHISISHSGDYIALILSENHKTGIDIEVYNDRILNIKNKFLSERELEKVFNNDLVYYLLLLWNAKEVMYKINDRKYLSFKENMYIPYFEPRNKGEFSGFVNTNNQTKEYSFKYERIEGYTIVWSLDK